MEAILELFENINDGALEKLDQYYTEDCYFRDPFNEVHNRDALYKLFKAMLKLKGLEFEIHDRIQQEDKAFITWDFRFKALGKQQCIHGGSLLKFAADGRVKSHVDYWDAAEGVYEKIPGLGSVLRLIKKAF
ncbi:nuclear transport factor 2 family protein [Ketobacter sp.]|uniref:nuclear transport factor 2 family protein n=1 Tax=Ketobacter sp. TaxID=2083498 RepID=UPI000F21C48B|nr:nuclear transport factor 2 family protein [Ketobacter sp.]RLT93993.1 MAG: nuclear transport factor 2 family protein [Ketobacter sp.]